MPPPSTVGCSTVYIVRRADGFFYCGESDDIKGAFWPAANFDNLCLQPVYTVNIPYTAVTQEAVGACTAKALWVLCAFRFRFVEGGAVQGGWRGTGVQGLSREAGPWRPCT